MTEYYTTDINFLKDTQKLLQTYEPPQKKVEYSGIMKAWNEIKNDTSFKDKYYYLDWQMLEFMNKSDQFLQIMSIYNLASPLISFFIPIIILIIPFFIIKVRGLEITMAEYVEVLKVVIKNNAIGKLFTEFNEVELNQKIYLLISASFYVFSIYQNVMVCMRFNSNMYKIHAYFNDIKQYLESTIESMGNYLKYANLLPSHSLFNENLRNKMNRLIDFKHKISFITEYKLSVRKVFEIGKILKYFYEFYCDLECDEAFLFSFGFNGYIDCLEGLLKNIEERKINFVKFNKEKKKKNVKNVLKNSYYAVLKDGEPVKNTINLDKNLIITGPNASGKTTVLKSTLINIILSQQFGCGFYESAKLTPFKHLHCYLNIPDTSGRDSLFQAEARRCKDILDIISGEKRCTHFCAFDELYSGTNPEEAICSAIAFMEYLIKNKRVKCLLTTHFNEICRKLDSNENVHNCHMDVTKAANNVIQYNYLLKDGVSSVKGGISVLSDMNYPKEIIENAILQTE
jgi:energy-coupling factor transporter ATP-binding protein EcfA2